MSLRVRRITSRQEFHGLAPVWAEVASQSGRTTPFMSHDWVSCCWQAAAPDETPELLLLEDMGGPVALIPLLHRRGRIRGLPVRSLVFLECPDTPFVDLLVATDVRPVVRAVVKHLEARSDWDLFRLPKLPTASPTLKALEIELSGRLQWRHAGASASPYLAINGTWEAFYGARSQRFKKTARNIHNRLERLGAVAIEEHRAVDPDGPLFLETIDLTTRSWKARRGVAIATMPRMRTFFAELTRLATARGWLALWLLRLDGRVIAMEYQLQANGIVHALRADYDLAYGAASPGSVLNFAIAKSLFEHGGVHEYDMGPGLNEYKLRWATSCHDATDVEVYAPRLYPRLLHALETLVVPAARRMRGRFP